MKAKLAKKMIGVTVCLLILFVMTAANVPAQKVTLVLEPCECHVSWFTPMAEWFMEENPEINLRLDWVPYSFERFFTHFLGGTGPDLFENADSWVHRFASLGWLLNMDPYLSRIPMEDMWPAMVEAFQYKGSQYAIAQYGDVYAYTYNVDLYKEVGLDPEQPPQDWAEFVNHMLKLTVPEKEQYGFGLIGKAGTHETGSYVNMYIRQNEGDVLNEDYTRSRLNEPAAIEATQFVADLVLKHKVVAPGLLEYEWKDLDALFAMGTVASYLAAATRAQLVYNKNPDINIYSAPMPKGKQWKGASMYGWGLSIWAETKYPDEAWKFIEFMVSPEVAQRIYIEMAGNVGPRISVARASSKLSQQPYTGVITSLEKGYGVASPGIEEWPQIALVETSEIQRIYLGLATVEEALNEATQKINKILEK